MNEPTDRRMAAACSLLAKEKRRYLLYQLAEDETAHIEDLVTQVAAWDDTVSTGQISSETRQQTYVSLVHNHLPRLADYDIIDYDLRSGDIVLADGFDDIKPLLEQFKQTEEKQELREQPPL
ncbi:DUF7344 domain-containing protein [Natronobacterium gregoryi]|uniref:DUF7344 domain-containing protein n=2 Tax=Natronobacterium gregoryi TaxID=44930 RepID=L0ANQ3_NATGS|nr:hypothetical protein [Natronobacterium gregoryi]AFZ74847.1 hypothetical protein Natgr_3744 [Natronobacterium gregoryi SP2]ELY64594.1 hypothetical protein C490_14535 [Natronobacterium gregoryi SP2]PLK18153.1 hypothetical protein CYV19_18585 [Natronobacterium gregoryi SP2]SFJ66502.1 hypothetical protein SAMN05443661_15411 [Natronobacterium gregoryi]